MICSLTAYNRPEYLKKVLESLGEAIDLCIEPVLLVVSIDASEQRQVIRKMVDSSPINTYTKVQAEHLGLQANTLDALSRAWEIAEAFTDDFVLHLEDDLVLAPDALNMACYMRDTYRESQDTGFISLTNVHNDPEPGKNGNCYRAPWFECHVWGTWRTIWDNLMLPEWPHDWYDHWAAFVNDHEMWDMYQVLPELSRSKSIGEIGTHSNADFHKTHNPKVWAGEIDQWELEPYTAEFNVPVPA